ncbi:hypothetical protein [Uliginosibacterium sp. H1]|uniref:hypothetical protein n=1 Tax=Uliginosibacterium sp. H1 TaxID=3114757 RepID=UPI002E1957E9|nr:hypothetical protein [Uliginosibacterium sp. H1]
MAASRALRFLLWITLSLLVLTALAGLALLFVNRHDEPVSESALKFTLMCQSRPPVADAQNAYVYALGFAAAQEDDPRRIGTQRMAQINAALQQPGKGLHSLVAPEQTLTLQRPPALRNLLGECRLMGPRCDAALTSRIDVVRQWLSDEAWLLDRHRALLANTDWLEPRPVEGRAAPSSTQLMSVMPAHEVLLAQAWLHARDGRPEAARALLEADHRFWRMVLANTESLTTKSIAATALKRHFQYANLALARLSPAQAAALIPSGWQQAISEEERSMTWALIGEWLYANTSLDLARRDALDEDAARRSAFEQVRHAFSSRLFKYQATSNQVAEQYMDVALALDRPISETADAMASVQQLQNRAQGLKTPWYSMAYNPIGKILTAFGHSRIDRHATNVANLEGLRRASLLAARLRATSDDVEQARQALNTPELYNPYSTEPMEWRPTERMVAFVGLTSGDQEIHSFVY